MTAAPASRLAGKPPFSLSAFRLLFSLCFLLLIVASAAVLCAVMCCRSAISGNACAPAGHSLRRPQPVNAQPTEQSKSKVAVLDPATAPAVSPTAPSTEASDSDTDTDADADADR